MKGICVFDIINKLSWWHVSPNCFGECWLDLWLYYHINIPKLSEDQTKLEVDLFYEDVLSEKDLYNYNSLINIENDKFPGNNGLRKEFYETFWNDLKEIFVDSVSTVKENGQLSASQRLILS